MQHLQHQPGPRRQVVAIGGGQGPAVFAAIVFRIVDRRLEVAVAGLEHLGPASDAAAAETVGDQHIGGGEAEVEPLRVVGVRIAHQSLAGHHLRQDAGVVAQVVAGAEVPEARGPGPLMGGDADLVAAVVVIEGVEGQAARRGPVQPSIVADAAVQLGGREGGGRLARGHVGIDGRQPDGAEGGGLEVGQAPAAEGQQRA